MSAVSNAGMLIVMAGLPGTGKSAIARELEKKFEAVILNKDEIRADLFSKGSIDYSREQDDLCMEIIFIIARYLFRIHPQQTIIIDGRTFSQSYQVEQLLKRAESLDREPQMIECVCDDAVAKQRLENDQRTGAHPARNRNYALYLDLKRKAEPIHVPHLVIDTGTSPLEKSVQQCLAFLKTRHP